jgi:hypothetical protein
MRVTYCIPVCPGWEMSTHYFLSSGGTCTDLTKNVSGHVMSNICFASGGICGSHSAFQCVWGMNRKDRQQVFATASLRDALKAGPWYL